MIPTIFDFGLFGIHSFGLMLLLSFISAWRLLWLRLKAVGEDPNLAEPIVFWAAVGGVIGARALYILSFPTQLLEDPLGVIFSGAGFVFYGGLFGGALAVVILVRRAGGEISRFADLIAPALALAYGVGRIGCHLSGDGDYGAISSLPWALSYEWGVVPTAVGFSAHPAPIYETILAFATTYYLLRFEATHPAARRGLLFAIYLALASAARFGVEFVRIEPQIFAGLTQAQLWAALLFGLSLVLILRLRFKVQE